MPDAAACPVFLSVIVPCHNPRRDYMDRVLAALQAQTLPRDAWELLVIDNASSPAVADWADLSWHPQGRIVTETTLGLTPARTKGISAARGDLLVLVDDDNVLAADYLEQAARIADDKPFLGAFGGIIDAEFEIPPPAWMRSSLGMFGVRDVPVSCWSNDIDHWASTPIGAGLCLRQHVALAYKESIEKDPVRRGLDRKGGSLVSGGDMDMAYTAVAMGLGMGVLRELQLTHLIPKRRISRDYIVKLSESIGYSAVILDALWGRDGATADAFPSTATVFKRGLTLLFNRVMSWPYVSARRKGIARGQQYLETLRPAGEPIGMVSTKGK